MFVIMMVVVMMKEETRIKVKRVDTDEQNSQIEEK